MLLIRVKRRPLGLDPFYLLFNPIAYTRVGNCGRNAPVMLNLTVKFDALLTHHLVLHLRARSSSHPSLL